MTRSVSSFTRTCFSPNFRHHPLLLQRSTHGSVSNSFAGPSARILGAGDGALDDGAVDGDGKPFSMSMSGNAEASPGPGVAARTLAASSAPSSHGRISRVCMRCSRMHRPCAAAMKFVHANHRTGAMQMRIHREQCERTRVTAMRAATAS